MSALDIVSANAASDMTRQLDAEIRAALTDRWGLFAAEDVKRRCQIVRIAGSPIETLHIDGVPALQIWPVEQETIATDTGWTLRLTRKVRRIPRAATTPQTRNLCTKGDVL